MLSWAGSPVRPGAMWPSPMRLSVVCVFPWIPAVHAWCNISSVLNVQRQFVS